MEIDVEKLYKDAENNRFLEGYQEQYKLGSNPSEPFEIFKFHATRSTHEFDRKQLSEGSYYFGRATASLMMMLNSLDVIQKNRPGIAQWQDLYKEGFKRYGAGLKDYEKAFDPDVDAKAMFEKRFIRAAKNNLFEGWFRELIQEAIDEFEIGYTSSKV